MIYPDCPTCGHNTSAFAGSCTAFVVLTEEEAANTGFYARHCDHDCSADVRGESLHDSFVRALWGGKS